MQIAGPTDRDHVDPGCPPTARAGNHVIERQMFGGKMVTAILAMEGIAQEHVEPGERRAAPHGYIFLQRDNAGQAEFQAGGMNDPVVFGHHVDPLKKYRLESVLPGPKGKREVAQRPEIGVKNECGTAFG